MCTKFNPRFSYHLVRKILVKNSSWGYLTKMPKSVYKEEVVLVSEGKKYENK